MELVLSTIDGAVMNALAFSSTNFSSVILWIMVKKNAKDMILHYFALEKLYRARDKWNEDKI